MNRQGVLEVMGPRYATQEKNRVKGFVKESLRPVVVRVSPARIQAFALIRSLADDDMVAINPIPRVILDCRVRDTSLDFANADELMDLYEWCERLLDVPGYAYTLLKETLQSFLTSIDKALPAIPDSPVTREPIMFGDYAVIVQDGGVVINKGTDQVHKVKTMKQALAWVSAKIAEAAA